MSNSGSGDFIGKIKKLFTNPRSLWHRHGSTSPSSSPMAPIDSQIDCIEANLYLGGRPVESHIELLEQYKITHILTIEENPLTGKITSMKNLKKIKFVQLSDQSEEDLLIYLEQTYDFINEGLAQGAVLVHCFIGMSRSASVVIAYIMKKYKLTYDEAFSKVYEKRNQIFPNPAFVNQLKLYRDMGYKLDPNNEKYKSIRLATAANKIRFFKSLPADFADLIQPDPGLDQSLHKVPQTSYCCKKCHRILAQESNRLAHSHRAEVCTEQFFFEPLAWMNVINQKQDDLVCPQCNATVGAFSWIPGLKCSCNVNVAPAFQLTVTEVDVVKPEL